MIKERNTPPLILIILVLAALLVVISFFTKTGTIGPKPTVTERTATAEKVIWQKPEELVKVNIFDLQEGFKENVSKYYLVGKIQGGTYDGGDVIVYVSAAADFEGPVINDTFYHFIRKNNTWFWITSNPGQYAEMAHPKFIIDTSYTIPGLAAPEFITYERTLLSYAFQYDPYSTAFWSDAPNHLEKVFTDKNIGDVYMVTKPTPNTPSNIFTRNGFYVRLPDNTTAVYSLIIPFIEKNGGTTITWNDGSVTTEDYSVTERNGCGNTNYAAVETSVTLEDLIAKGKASGNTIYELKDRNHKLLKDTYKRVASYTAIPYEQYVAGHPIIFWFDPFGRLIRLENMRFLPQAECGKPVIYLYPEKTTHVHVQLAPVNGFSYTEPTYNNGWNVIAEPQGTLIDEKSGKRYPYLFWEGRGGIYETPTKGFVVAQKDVHSFLTTKLSLLGLNARESKDFIDFWEPRMQGSPYYFVTFMGNEVMDRLAPLTITPRPDTIIRILMDFTPLKQPMNVAGYDITTPVRKGFTVVEWGGVVR